MIFDDSEEVLIYKGSWKNEKIKKRKKARHHIAKQQHCKKPHIMGCPPTTDHAI